MSFILRFVMLMMLALFSMQTVAGRNPVGWSVNRSFPSEVIVGRSYTVTYTFTSNLPFTMVKPLNIIKNATPASDFTYSDTCSGLKLASHQSCTVQVMLTPSAATTESVQLVIAGYDNNHVPVSGQSTQTIGQGVGDIYGLVTKYLPQSLYLGISGNFGFSFTNNTNSTISNVSLNVTGNGGGTVTDTTQNCGSTLGAKQSCIITGNYVAKTASPTKQGVEATLTYGSGKSVSVSTTTTIKTGAGVVASFIGFDYLAGIAAPAAPSFAGPYPNNAGAFPTQTVGVLFTNTGTATDPTGSASITTGTNPPTLTVSNGCATITMASTAYNNCANATLTLGSACQMIGVVDTSGCTVSPPVVVTVTSQVTSSTIPTTVSLATTTNLIPQSDIGTSRTINFVNNCNFPVWYSLNGASEPGSCSTVTGLGCPTGTSCYQSKGTCFWSNYPLASPTPNLLAANTGAASVTIPATTTDPTVQWSGVISASLNCSGGTCGQAACSNPNGVSCAAGVGFNQPATQAEFTLLLNGADTYDVETINGFHLPISITPIYSITPAIPAPTPSTAADGYNCGIPGNNATLPGITGGCDWTAAAPPSKALYTWITAATGSCTTNTNCTSSPNLVCGMDSSFNLGCGQFLGYWSADQVCGSTTNPTIRSLFSCDAPLSSYTPTGLFPSGDTLYQLMGCTVAKGDTTNAKFNSCYLNYASSPTNNPEQCCGCMDWWTIGIAANSTSNTCVETDPIWNNQVQSTVQWMKTVCPTAYVYPFDDKTSTYTCTNTINNGVAANSTSYTITFCPGSNTGLPSGVPGGGEGR